MDLIQLIGKLIAHKENAAHGEPGRRGWETLSAGAAYRDPAAGGRGLSPRMMPSIVHQIIWQKPHTTTVREVAGLAI